MMPSAPSILAALVVALAAFAGGALNAVAGGGSFLVFPAMIFAGLSPREANASTTVGLWPAALASLGGYRDHLRGFGRVGFLMCAASLVGGLTGAFLLLRTSSATFERVLPFLLLGATALFAAGPAVTKRVADARTRRGASATGPGSAALAAGCLVQLVISTYGGYFGGGMGILMLATLSLMGMTDLPRMNALKVAFALCINGVASIAFIASGVVHYGNVAAAAAGGVLGGFAGARAGTRVDPRVLRAVVVVAGLALTVRFFLR